MRHIKDLLLISKKNRETLNNPAVGLCTRIAYLHSKGRITGEEFDALFVVLESNRPKNADKYSPWWFPEDGIERGKFLDKLIKKYSKVKK